MKTVNAIAALAAVALAVPSAKAQTAREIVARSDSVRNPSQPFHVTNAVVDYVGGNASDRLVLTIYSKRRSADDAFDNLVRYAEPPRDVGKMVLFNGTNMWFYDPSSKASVRISPQQRLIGLASNGDVVTVSLARDYTSTLVGIDTLQDADRVQRVAWHLDLVAADKDAVYSRIELWVERGTYRPVKGKYYSDSGRLLKIAYFHKYQEQLGAIRPGEAVIIDAVDPKRVTTMTLSDYVAQDIPDAWFQRDFLPRLSALGTTEPRGEDRDLAALPTAVEHDTASAHTATPRTTRGRYEVENAATTTSVRTRLLVAQPGAAPADWEERLSADVRDRWPVSAHLALTLSGRVNAIERAGEDRGVASGYDFREGYVTWEPASRTYLEAGRINVHNGVALGFNPTDVFRARTLIDHASLDPSVLREDRLGTLMIRAEHLWRGAEASIAFAPKLYEPTNTLGEAPTSARLELDRTNAVDRWLATVSADLAGLAPTLTLYHEGARTQVGVTLSRLVSQSVVAYAEYMGGVTLDLVDEATRYGRATGAIPKTAPGPSLDDSGERMRSDLAAGASWTASAAKLTINAEYHYHEAGFDRAEWRRWFSLGESSPSIAAELWYIRAFANDRQQPMARQQIFVRADREDALLRNLELTMFAFTNLADRSSLVQSAASYLASDAWTLALYVAANVGSTRSERGSMQQLRSVTARVVRFL